MGLCLGLNGTNHLYRFLDRLARARAAPLYPQLLRKGIGLAGGQAAEVRKHGRDAEIPAAYSSSTNTTTPVYVV